MCAVGRRREGRSRYQQAFYLSGEIRLSQVLYVPKESGFHGIDFRVKLLWAISIPLLCYLVLETISSLLLVFVWVLLVMLYARLVREILFRFARFFLIIAVISIFAQGLVHGGGAVILGIPPSVPLIGGRAILSLEGIRVGALVTLRLMNMASALMIIFLSSSPNQVSRGLMKLGLPFKYSMLFNMLIRFYPLMATEFSEIQSAQASRAFDVEKGDFLQKFRNFLPILIPTLLSALRKSTGIAITAEMRGLSMKSKRTFIHDTEVGGKDWLFFASTAVLLASFVSVRFLGYLF